MRLESWQNANEQARAAAAGMLGQPAPAEPYPWFWTDQYGCNVQMLGLPQPGLVHACRGVPQQAETPRFIWLGHRDGVPVHAIAVNAGGDLRQLRVLFEQAIAIDPQRYADETVAPQAAGEGMPAARHDLKPIAAPYRLELVMYQSQTVIGLTMASKHRADRLSGRRTRCITSRTGSTPAAPSMTRKSRRYSTARPGTTWPWKPSCPTGRLQAVLCRTDPGGGLARRGRLGQCLREPLRPPWRGVLPQQPGQRQEFVCPYHQWSYDLKGNLQGIPFKARCEPRGRHAQDFKNEEHGLRKLRVATRNGVIFASYSDEVEALEEYLTPAILADFDTVFPGKKLKIHGYYRNELPCNWKMYHENLKDPYHATLLHSFLVVFGLLVAGNKSAMLVDTVHGRHGTMASARARTNTPASAKTRRNALVP